jgi:putative ABC transport system permease protein
LSYVEVSLPRLAIGLFFIAIACAVSWRLRLGLGSDLAVGTLRAAVQLVGIGYFLVFLFAHQEAWMVLALLVTMLLVAAMTCARRVQHEGATGVLVAYALAAVGGGAAVALLPMFALILRPHPWFEARYLVPISGMMMSNAMNVVAQVFERVFAAARSERAIIEQLLALGASPAQATQTQTRAAVRAALIPTINGLVTVGLVALPGMMTGQVLSGAPPEQAVRYQLVIMYQLVVVAAVSGALAAFLAVRLLFTRRDQLRVS